MTPALAALERIELQRHWIGNQAAYDQFVADLSLIRDQLVAAERDAALFAYIAKDMDAYIADDGSWACTIDHGWICPAQHSSEPTPREVLATARGAEG